MIIEPGSPEHWQDLQNAVGRILREAGLEVQIDTPVELQLGSVFMIAYSPLPGRSQPVFPPLPLSEAFAEQPDVRLPDDLLESRTLRELVDRLVAHAREAIRQFDEVFGERA